MVYFFFFPLGSSQPAQHGKIGLYQLNSERKRVKGENDRGGEMAHDKKNNNNLALHLLSNDQNCSGVTFGCSRTRLRRSVAAGAL